MTQEASQPREVPDTGARDGATVAVNAAGVAVVAVLVGIQTWQQQFSGDVFAHLAVVRELSANPLDQTNPFVSSADPTFYFSP